MGVASTTPSPIVPGYRLDRYELLCPLAEGGMASVWLARIEGKHGFQKLVAIKMILPAFAEDPRFEAMFLDEAGIASQISHANVAQILDLGEQDGVLYLAMEWVDGDPLSKVLRAVRRRGDTLPLGVTLRILADTCAGLHAAHELRGADKSLLGVVHRDISPQNILVSQDGVAKLIDFGIAKARDRVGAETSSGTLKGKVHFMAPEQALGSRIDRRADVWAVGATLYYLLSGKPPYQADNELATLHLLTSGRPPLPLPQSVHPSVAGIVRRALTHSLDERFASAADMQAAFEEASAEAGAFTTTSDVAAFVRDEMTEHAQRRRAGIESALAAAGHRARVARSLAATGSSPALADASGGVPLASLAAASGPIMPVSSSTPGALWTPTPPTETSSATLGSAALSGPVVTTSQPPRRRGTIALMVGLLAVGGLGGIGLHAAVQGVRSARASGAGGVTSPSPAAPLPAASVAVVAQPAVEAKTEAPAPPKTGTDWAPAKVEPADAVDAAVIPATPPAPATSLETSPPAQTAPAPRAQPAAASPATPTPATRPAKRRRVDYGF